MGIKTYVNDGTNYSDGLGARPSTLAADVSDVWYIDFEKDKNFRGEIRAAPTAGVQIKNGSNQPIAVKIEGSSLAQLFIPKKATENVIVERPAGISIQNIGSDTIAASTIAVTVTTGANQVSGATGLGDIYITQDFGGEVYYGSYTAKDDVAHPFTESTLKLADAILVVSDASAYVGSADEVGLLLSPGDKLGISKIDLSTLYIQNVTAGNNTTISVFGVKI